MNLKRTANLLFHSKREALTYLIEEQNENKKYMIVEDAAAGMALWTSSYEKSLVPTVITGGTSKERLALEIGSLKSAAAHNQPILILHFQNKKLVTWLKKWKEMPLYCSETGQLQLISEKNELAFWYRLASIYRGEEPELNEVGKVLSYLKFLWSVYREAGNAASLDTFFLMHSPDVLEMQGALEKYEEFWPIKNAGDYFLSRLQEDFDMVFPVPCGQHTPEDILASGGICCIDVSTSSDHLIDEYLMIMAEEITKTWKKNGIDRRLLLIIDNPCLVKENQRFNRFIHSPYSSIDLVLVFEDVARNVINEEQFHTIMKLGKNLGILSHNPASAEIIARQLEQYYHVNINIVNEGHRSRHNLLEENQNEGFTTSKEKRPRLESSDITALKEKQGEAWILTAGSSQLYHITLQPPDWQ